MCGIFVHRFTVLLDAMEQSPMVVRDIILTFVVLHNMLRTHRGGTDRTPISTNDIAALQNEQVMYVRDDNYCNPLGRPKISETY